MKRRVEFWSSTEGASFQRALVGELSKANMPSELCYEVPQSAYWTARSGPARLALRLRAYGAYPVRLALRFMRAPQGLVAVVCTNTFYAPWIALKAARPGVPVVHWVFDLFPDVLVAAGKLHPGGIVECSLRRIVRITFHRAAANVFLGEHLLRHAEARFGPIPRAYVIPVGADGTPFRDSPPQPRSGGTAVKILYCGNLGRMHDVDTVVAVVKRGLPAGIEMEFCGNGAGFFVLEEALRDAAVASRVRLGGNLPDLEWASAMRAADVALVTMRTGAEGLIMPSKTYSAMVAGQAILAVCARESDLADLVRKHDAGWVVAPGDASGLSALLQRIACTPEEILTKRRNAWRAGQAHYDQSMLTSAWVGVLETAAPMNVDFGKAIV